MLTLSQLQKEHANWQLVNFGPQTTWAMLLGIVEEFGEYSETITEFEIVSAELMNLDHPAGKRFNWEAWADAIGDIMIYTAAFCSTLGWDLQALWDSKPNAKRDFAQFNVALGKLSHSVLKTHQGIRGSREEHERKGKEALQRFLAELNGMCEVVNQDLVKITNDTWARVSKRNWVADKVKGGEA